MNRIKWFRNLTGDEQLDLFAHAILWVITVANIASIHNVLGISVSLTLMCILIKDYHELADRGLVG